MGQGLTTQQVATLLKQNGYNQIPQKHPNVVQKIWKNLMSPIALMLITASVLSFALGKILDGYFILGLLILNVGITIWQESKADNAIQKLNEHLKQKNKVLRDNSWQQVDSRFLVTGDIVQLGPGEVIPADGKIVKANRVQINESALTGESLPKEKKENDQVFSGSFMSSGIATIEITATGSKTNFGKTIFSVEKITKKSMLEKDILNISKFLIFLSLIAVVILTAVFLFEKISFLELLTLNLSLIIAGIPTSLPTVMTLIIEFGIIALAKKDVIVRRLSSLEDLANVNFLLTDKTGTLTENKIVVHSVSYYGNNTIDDVLLNAALVATNETDNPINQAILEKVKEQNIQIPNHTTTNFIPADSERKRSTATIKQDGKTMVISTGAPQIIIALCKMDKETKEKYNKEVATLALSGYRTIAVAYIKNSTQEKNMQLVGLLALSDTLRNDAKRVIEFLKENTIGVAIVTGDNRAIASTISKELNLNNGTVVTKDQLQKMHWDNINASFFNNAGAFAEILPDDKLRLVKKAKQFFTVAADGDGVNDFPAIKAAHVGIAVTNAVSAVKATADIVLLSKGISVIRDAIIEGRKIFARLYTYSLYRISESLRLIVTIVILGILYRLYPLTPLQIIVVALLNDIPIISLASDRVKITSRPAKINAKKRFFLSSLYGLIGVANSLLLFFLMQNVWHLSWEIIQTMYFLKLTVSGHMLIYVAHTKERWWKFLPSNGVILATTLTQLFATILALTGFFMPSKISLLSVIFVWGWSFFWMQLAEVSKIIEQKVNK